MFDYVFSENAMAELGRLLIYEASREWLVSSFITPILDSWCCIVFFSFVINWKRANFVFLDKAICRLLVYLGMYVKLIARISIYGYKFDLKFGVFLITVSQLSAERSRRQWVLQQWNLLIQGNPLQLVSISNIILLSTFYMILNEVVTFCLKFFTLVVGYFA